MAANELKYSHTAVTVVKRCYNSVQNFDNFSTTENTGVEMLVDGPVSVTVDHFY